MLVLVLLAIYGLFFYHANKHLETIIALLDEAIPHTSDEEDEVVDGE